MGFLFEVHEMKKAVPEIHSGTASYYVGLTTERTNFLAQNICLIQDFESNVSCNEINSAYLVLRTKKPLVVHKRLWIKDIELLIGETDEKEMLLICFY